jgi:hypothetical protein
MALGGDPPRVSQVVGAEIRLSGPGAIRDEGSAAVAAADGAGYLVVWEDDRNATTRGSDIYGRPLSATGVPAGPEVRLSGPNALTDEFDPGLAWNGSEFLVVWEDRRKMSTRGSEIYGRRLSATGVPAGPDFRVSGLGATGDEYTPAVAWNGTEYLVVWQDGRHIYTRGQDLYGRRVSAAGIPIGGDFRISGPGATLSEEDPALAWSGSGYLVVWADYRNLATRGGDVFGQLLAADGSLQGSNFRISGFAAIGTDREPAVAWSGWASAFLVAWDDGRLTATRGSDIYARRVSAAGAPIGAEFRVSGPGAVGNELQTAAVASNGPEWLVAWTDERDFATRGRDIYGQRVSSDGSRIGSNFRINGLPGVDHSDQPALAWNSGESQYLVAWSDARNSLTRGYDIYGVRVAG